MPKLLLQLVTVLLLTLANSSTVSAQVALERVGGGGAAKGATNYHYLFENERFTTPLIEIGIDGQGHGRFRFRRKDSEEITNQISVSMALVNQIQSLFDEVRFLDTQEDYQYKKDFSHLGKITLKLSRDGRQRSATFNYTSNPAISRLTDIFRSIATQENRVFEIETIRESDPISTPAQLRMLESELRSKQIAEPERLTPLLEKIKTDESVPLIARNHADRLLKMIQKAR
ncbi:MAG: hypothetical protein ABI882_06980 [Acidobacteriota bacterium]